MSTSIFKNFSFVLWVVACSSQLCHSICLSDDNDPVKSICSAITANNLAIKRYEIIVREHFLREITNPEEVAYLGWNEWEAFSRIWIDYEQERCLYLTRIQRFPVVSPNLANNVRLPDAIQWKRAQIQNGEDRYIVLPDLFELTLANPTAKNGLLTRRNSDFSTFLRVNSIPMVDMIGIKGFYSPISLPREEYAIKYCWTNETASMTTLPDGSTTLSFPPEPRANGFISRKTISARTQMPISSVVSTGHGDKKYISSSQEMDMEEVDGIYRVRQLNVQRRTVGLKNPEKGEYPAVDETGTIEVQWLQFNGQAIRFPTDEELGEGPKQWEKLLELRR